MHGVMPRENCQVLTWRLKALISKTLLAISVARVKPGSRLQNIGVWQGVLYNILAMIMRRLALHPGGNGSNLKGVHRGVATGSLKPAEMSRGNSGVEGSGTACKR